MPTYKDKMSEAIIDSAQELFLEKSISKVLISDIAKAAGIGEATVYRYFKTKQNLALKVALKEWNHVFESFQGNIQGNGYDRLLAFYQMFYVTFQEHPNFFSFLFEFDQLILNDTSLDFSGYQDALLKVKGLFDEAYQLGIDDGSIKTTADKDLFYYTTTHALLSLCKKLATDNLIDKNVSINKEEEIRLLIILIMNELKGGKGNETIK